ncbi:MAG: hypothetical protein L0Y36_06790, partial [Planctomycetales bacterium]|nr:hypothetical protein [Planctomycetales bacterium]
HRTLTEQVDQARQENQQLIEQIDELRKGDEGLRRTIGRLNEEIRTARTQAEVLPEMTEKLETLHAELAQTQQLLSEEHQSKLALNQEMEHLQAAADENARQKETLQAESAVLRDQFEQERRDITGQLEHVLLEKQRIQTGFEKLRAEYSEYHSHVCTEKTELQQQIAQLTGEHQALKEANTQLSSLIEERNNLQNRLNEYRVRQDELAAELTALRNRLDEDLQSHNLRLEYIQKQHQNTLAQNEHLTNTLSAIRKQLEEAAQTAQHHRYKAELFDAAQAFWQKTLQEIEHPQEQFAEAPIPEDAHPQETPLQPEPVQPEELTTPSDETAAHEASDAAQQIPMFNLAEQILAEHRRPVSARRQRIEPAEAAGRHEAIRQVVEHYVCPAAAASEKPHEPAGFSFDFADDNTLSPFQRELLEEIIQKDVERLSETATHRKALLMTS